MTLDTVARRRHEISFGTAPPVRYDGEVRHQVSPARSFSLALLVACGPTAPSPAMTEASAAAEPSTSAVPTTGKVDPGLEPDMAIPSACGSVCVETRVHTGALTITPETPPESLRCIEKITGLVGIHDFDGPLPAELRALREVDDALFISNNHGGLVDLAGLDCLQRVDALYLSSNDGLADIDALAGLVSCPSVDISSGGAPSDLSSLSTITDMTALSVWGDTFEVLPTPPTGTHLKTLRLVDCAGLTNLAPLPGLRVTHVSLDGLPALTSIAPMAGWWGGGDPAGSVFLARMAQLGSLQGLEGAGELESLTLHDLPQLTSLAALADLQRVRFLSLTQLPALASLEGFTSLDRVEQLEIGYCTAAGLDMLIDLTGLGAVTTVVSMSILGNQGMQSLAGMDVLTDGPQFLVVADNPQIPQPVLDEFIATHAVPEAVTCIEEGDCCGF